MDVGAVLSGHIVNNLRFADDIAAVAENSHDLRLIVDNIATESTKMGMQINIEKTEIQHVGQIEKELNINIKKQNLNQVKETLYAWVETHVVMLRPSRMLKEG